MIRTVASKAVNRFWPARLALRFIRQQPIKTWRTLTQPSRLFGTVWAESQARDFATFARSLDASLYEEARSFEQSFATEKAKTLSHLPISGGLPGVVGGGGGNAALLYFLVRYLKPANVLEAGVSAGTSSRAMLEAMEKNGHGTLYSSDLVEFLAPEDVGVLVPERLRHRWHLYREGDAIDVPKILRAVETFDLVYYDAEKSPSAKAHFVEMVSEAAREAVMVIDDVDRDSFFRKWAKGRNFRVFGNAAVVGHRIGL